MKNGDLLSSKTQQALSVCSYMNKV